MEGGGGGGGLGTMRAVLAILQWWGFNVTVIITNKWIFQVPFPSHLAPSRLIVAGRPHCSLGSRDSYLCVRLVLSSTVLNLVVAW
jgi:hypothetical protein